MNPFITVEDSIAELGIPVIKLEKITRVTTKPCPVCGATSIMDVASEGYAKWKGGGLIQDALPELDAGAREMLITGIHPDCWRKVFGPDEEEEYPPWPPEDCAEED